jgi:hypothetical protein
MHKALTLVVTVLLLSFAGGVAAQATATGNAAAQAQAGNSSAMNVNGTGNLQQIIVQGGELPKMLPQPPVAPVAVPQVFNTVGLPAEMVAAAVDEAYLTQCEPSNEGSAPQHGEDSTQHVKWTFTPHQNLAILAKAGDQKPVVKVNFTGRASLICLGQLLIGATPESIKAGYPIGISALATIAMGSIASSVSGVAGEVTLVSHRGNVGGTLAQSSEGKGGTAGGGFNLGFAAATLGGSSIKGTTTPMARMSMAFIVGIRVPAEDPRAVHINVVPPPPPPK